MDTFLGIIGLIVLIFVVYQITRAKQALGKKANQKVFLRGAHQKGQQLVTQDLHFTSHASVDQVRNAVLSAVKVAPGVPAVIADAYLISASDTFIIYGCGTKLRESFRGVLQLRATSAGTAGTWEIANWTLADGIVAGQSVMKRLIADINTGLGSVDPNARLQ